jgi:hypothetical protein
MMLLYGVIRGISALLRRYVEWMHKRAQNAYELAETAFGELEASCKAEEVALGRPIDYASQLKLLKAYERREAAKQRWVNAAARSGRSKSAEDRLRSFSQMRLPYTFGLIDMAFLMRVLDHFGVLPQFEQPLIKALFAVLFE